jgi:hypothetical protein
MTVRDTIATGATTTVFGVVNSASSGLLTVKENGDTAIAGGASVAGGLSVTGSITASGGLTLTCTGCITSTHITDGTIVNADINASAAIADTKLATISTTGKVLNSATSATPSNTASAIVARDPSGGFTAGGVNLYPPSGQMALYAVSDDFATIQGQNSTGWIDRHAVPNGWERWRGFIRHRRCRRRARGGSVGGPA